MPRSSALGDATQPVLAFQPIADLTRGVVVGYEALARFAGPPVAPPDQSFRAAVELGNGPLEARVITDALASRDALPPGCLLSVNVSPDVLLSPAVSAAFATGDALDRLVVELTDTPPPTSRHSWPGCGACASSAPTSPSTTRAPATPA